MKSVKDYLRDVNRMKKKKLKLIRFWGKSIEIEGLEKIES